jgi:phage terminase large subunit-like protein
MIQKYFNAKEASEFYQKNFNIIISDRTVQRWCRSDKLDSIKPGKSRYMTRQMLIDAIEAEMQTTV